MSRWPASSTAGKTWYGNPLLTDTNQDGVFDGAGVEPSKPDTDGDGTPDLYDLRRRRGWGARRGGHLRARSATRPAAASPSPSPKPARCSLTVDGLNPGSYTYVDLQLRPTNPDRLWYAFNVLNWPKDEKGNAQDWDGATFYDYCVRTGGSNCKMAPDDNGDIKLVPMLEVAMPDLSTLPRRGNGSVDKELLATTTASPYSRPATAPGWSMCPSPWWKTPSPRARSLSAASCLPGRGDLEAPAGAAGVGDQHAQRAVRERRSCAGDPKKNGNKGDNKVIILHAYYDDFLITGFNVREDRGVDMAIVYEDPAPDTDAQRGRRPLPDDHRAAGQLFHQPRLRPCEPGAVHRQRAAGYHHRGHRQRWDHATNTGITEGSAGASATICRWKPIPFRAQDEATMTRAAGRSPPDSR